MINYLITVNKRPNHPPWHCRLFHSIYTHLYIIHHFMLGQKKTKKGSSLKDFTKEDFKILIFNFIWVSK